MQVPTPSFQKRNSLVYLIKFYYDCTWKSDTPPELFSTWLRRVWPETRDITTNDNPVVYTCNAHATNPEAPECCQYICSAHLADPSVPECSEFACTVAVATPPELTVTVCMTDILNVPEVAKEEFLSRVDVYYSFLIDTVLQGLRPECLKLQCNPMKLLVSIAL